MNCPVGTFFNVVSGECEPCPEGSYQPEESGLTCLVCPGRTSSAGRGAKSREDCKGER